jgi:hypothetical protein
VAQVSWREFVLSCCFVPDARGLLSSFSERSRHHHPNHRRRRRSSSSSRARLRRADRADTLACVCGMFVRCGAGFWASSLHTMPWLSSARASGRLRSRCVAPRCRRAVVRGERPEPACCSRPPLSCCPCPPLSFLPPRCGHRARARSGIVAPCARRAACVLSTCGRSQPDCGASLT